MRKILAFAIAIIVILGVWVALDYKLLFGGAWLSETYDNPDWHTNEGNLHTYGAWDLETHVWKTEYIMKYFPDFQYTPDWYLGMPLLKYYQSGFYIVHIAFIKVSSLSAPRAALLLIVFSHLLATLIAFALCYRVSKKIWVSMLCSLFLLSNTFISLRSYGWEPVTTVFLFLYPLGLMFFLKDPKKPFRLSLILVMAVSYLCHPLIFFSLCMTMGLFLLSIAIRPKKYMVNDGHYIWKYLAVVFVSLLLGAVQFIPQMSYEQVTSGAHMGLKYIPFYHVKPNVIALQDFFFDAMNLKGPGPIIMIAFFLLVMFSLINYRQKKKDKNYHGIWNDQLVTGFAFVLFMMVLFYYLELYNIFPMNFLRSIQYHRIIPEFVIAAAVLIAGLSNIAYKPQEKTVYYVMLIAFVLASGINIYNIQSHWATTDDISNKPEFINDSFEGRISFPYTDQSLSVRSSFNEIPQAYGYYEQGITNPYADEIFSVSSGFHNSEITLLYLKAANIGRLYINMEEGDRDQRMLNRLKGIVPFNYNNDTRYGYFEIPLVNPNLVQIVDGSRIGDVDKLEPKCRVMFKETYCGSKGEEFVSTDKEEMNYLRAYLNLVEQNSSLPSVKYDKLSPEKYIIHVSNADVNSAIIVKMTYDRDFVATIVSDYGEKVSIRPFGPFYMLIEPHKIGSYDLKLEYKTSKLLILGAIISVLSFVALILVFVFKDRFDFAKYSKVKFRRGEMQ